MATDPGRWVYLYIYIYIFIFFARTMNATQPKREVNTEPIPHAQAQTEL